VWRVHPVIVTFLHVAEIVVVEIAEAALAETVLADISVAALHVFVNRVNRLVAAGPVAKVGLGLQALGNFLVGPELLDRADRAVVVGQVSQTDIRYYIAFILIIITIYSLIAFLWV